MSIFRIFVFVLLAGNVSISSHAQNMNNETLEKILYVVSDTIQGSAGGWEFAVSGLPMLCITDETNNRMRIISPVMAMEDVTEEQIQETLKANFHSALDVKYAVSEDIMWVVYIHQLQELTKDQVLSAVSQVYNAHATFGTTYSSTNLTFPKQNEDPKPKKKKRTGRS